MVLDLASGCRQHGVGVDVLLEPGVVDAAEKPGGHLQHQGPFAEVEHGHDVHRVRVRREEQRLGIHQFGEHDDLVVLDADIEKALAHGGQADALHGVHERLEGVEGGPGLTQHAPRNVVVLVPHRLAGAENELGTLRSPVETM